jgi:acyl-coenzyme A thioesterase PaaI-like protein
MVDSLRRLQDLVTCSDPSPTDAAAAAALIDQVSDRLEVSSVRPGHHLSGLRGDVAGRGHPFVVPIEIQSFDGERVAGVVEFAPFHVGGGTAAHGGAVAVMFDEIMGRLTNNGPPSRTAFLHVDYRRVAPIGERFDVSAWVTRREGRKIFVAAELVGPDGLIIASSTGLWVIMRADATPEERGVIQ